MLSMFPHVAICIQVLGDRSLMEHEVVGQLRHSTNSEYLHVFVRLSDVASVTLDTEPSRPLTFDLSESPNSTLSPGSALTHSLVTAKPVQPSPESRSAIQLPSCFRYFLQHTLSLLLRHCNYAVWNPRAQHVVQHVWCKALSQVETSDTHYLLFLLSVCCCAA